MVGGAFLAVLVMALSHPWCLLALLALPLAVPPTRAVLAGARGRDLIAVLGADRPAGVRLRGAGRHRTRAGVPGLTAEPVGTVAV